jgi:hypothetical protein
VFCVLYFCGGGGGVLLLLLLLQSVVVQHTEVVLVVVAAAIASWERLQEASAALGVRRPIRTARGGRRGWVEIV